MKMVKRLFNIRDEERCSSKEKEKIKALARADDDGFAIQKSKEDIISNQILKCMHGKEERMTNEKNEVKKKPWLDIKSGQNSEEKKPEQKKAEKKSSDCS